MRSCTSLAVVTPGNFLTGWFCLFQVIFRKHHCRMLALHASFLLVLVSIVFLLPSNAAPNVETSFICGFGADHTCQFEDGSSPVRCPRLLPSCIVSPLSLLLTQLTFCLQFCLKLENDECTPSTLGYYIRSASRINNITGAREYRLQAYFDTGCTVALGDDYDTGFLSTASCVFFGSVAARRLLACII